VKRKGQLRGQAAKATRVYLRIVLNYYQCEFKINNSIVYFQIVLI